jgi:hypothetical protein
VRAALGLERHPAVLRAWQTTATFTLVGIGWVFFRAGSLGDAWYVTTHLTRGVGAQLSSILARDPAAIASLVFLGAEPSRVALAVAAVAALLVVEHVQGATRLSLRTRIAGARTPVRWAAYACAVLTIMTLGVFQSARFIYFQF